MSYRAAGGGVIDSYSCSLLFAIRRPLFAVSTFAHVKVVWLLYLTRLSVRLETSVPLYSRADFSIHQFISWEERDGEGGGGDSLNESVTITDNRPSQDTLTQTIRPYDQKSDIVVIYSIGKIWISPGWDQSLSIACGVQGEQMGEGEGGWHNQNPPTPAGHDWLAVIFLPRNLDL